MDDLWSKEVKLRFHFHYLKINARGAYSQNLDVVATKETITFLEVLEIIMYDASAAHNCMPLSVLLLR